MTDANFTHKSIEIDPEPKEVLIRQVVTTERTSKKYKLGILIGFTIFILGVGGTSHAYLVNKEQWVLYFNIGFMAFGFILWRGSHLLAWWNNG